MSAGVFAVPKGGRGRRRPPALIALCASAALAAGAGGAEGEPEPAEPAAAPASSEPAGAPAGSSEPAETPPAGATAATPAPAPAALEPLDQRFGIELPAAPAAAPPRSDEGRRKGLEFAVAAAEDVLAKAREALDEELKERRERAAKQAERVLAATASASGEGDDPKVTAYDEDGFTVVVGGAEVRYRWGSCPARLGYRVRELASDPEAADEAIYLGLYALERGLLDEAEEAFQRGWTKNPIFRGQVPDVPELRRELALLRGECEPAEPTIQRGQDVTVRWRFRGEEGAHAAADFTADGGVRIETVAGQLKVTGLASDRAVVAARIRGRWDEQARLSVVAAATTPWPAVLVSGEERTYLIRFADELAVARWEGGQGHGAAGEALASEPGAPRPGDRLTVEVTRLDEERVRIAARSGERAAVEVEVPLAGAFALHLGALDAGPARFAEVDLTGRLDDAWVRQTRAEGPAGLVSLVQRFVGRFFQMRARGRPALLAVTSAEDYLGLADVSDEAKEALKEGRAHIARGELREARARLEAALRLSPGLPAASYLLGLTLLRDEPLAALVRFEEASRGIEQFHEAAAAEASASARLRLDAAAEEAAARALALRPDSVLAHQAQAGLALARGEYERARELYQLVDQLAPGESTTFDGLTRLEALMDGPAWSVEPGERPDAATSDHFAVETDRAAGDAAKIARRLERLRDLWREALPALAAAEDRVALDAPARVLVFRELTAFEVFVARIRAPKPAGALAFFDARARLLVAALPKGQEGEGLTQLDHEAFHQACHRARLTLPPWAAEGLAELFAGRRRPGSGEDGGPPLTPNLRESLPDLAKGWEKRVPLADLARRDVSEFFAGDTPLQYAQAWTLCHLLLEGGDEEDARELNRYLATFALLADPAPRRALGHEASRWAFDQSLGRLDDLQLRWERHVQGLAERTGVELPARR